MPHQCTACGRTFPDGSKQMLSGCPDCGGNKFQFLPSDAVDAGADTPDDPPSDDIIEAPVEPDAQPETEDRAQASARRAVVSDDELPRSDPGTGADGPGDSPAGKRGNDRPDLAELRDELNEQFESIKILRPGEYELNLMELYDRDEYIVALEEDGRYVIDVPSGWHED